VADIYELAHIFRLGILRRERKTAALLASDYREAAKAMRADLDSLLVKIAEAREAGETVGESWLLRQRRFESLLIQVDEEIRKFSAIAEGRIIEAQGQAIEASLAQSYELMSAALGDIPGVNITFHRLPRLAVENLAGFLSDSSPLSSILSALSADAVSVVRASLINGVVSGQGVREIARGMREALGGNLRRAQVLARTEVLRAYRETSRQTYSANRDVLNGWRWHSALDRRTCAICYAMHGTLHGFNETLNDHPQGRCVMLPETKSYRELGLDIPDDRRPVESGESRFAKLTAEQQQAVLGRGAYERYRAGKLKLPDLVGERVDPKWGLVRYRKPLSEVAQ
jgi:SPP1 gp7 family putative phage head morphogenesis protein